MVTFNNITAESFAQETIQGAGRRRQRHREAVSCLQCRQKKVKCDRNRPCNPCRSRRAPSRCVYTHTGSVNTSRGEDGQSAVARSHPTATTEHLRESAYHSESLLSTSRPSSPDNPKLSFYELPTLQTDLEVDDEDEKQSNIRLPGETHWMFACNELPTLRQILEKSPAFADSRNAFRHVKHQLRAANALPPPLFHYSLDSDFLIRLLPDRAQCEHWTSRYFETYGKLFDFIHPKAVSQITESIWSNLPTVQHTSTALVLLIIAVAMQNDDDNRLLGRAVAQQLQIFFNDSSVLHIPSLEGFQNLCLLVLLKHIAASDTDKLDGMSSVLCKTKRMAFEMGLHRDPSLFPRIGSYGVGLRKRLWSIFFRLALEYSVQTGTPFIIRTKEAPCPLPYSVAWEYSQNDVVDSSAAKDISTSTLSTFATAMCKLGTLAASIQQALCSSIPELSIQSCKDFRQRSQQILTAIPKPLQTETSTTNEINRLQQSTIDVLVHRSSLLLSIHLLLIKCTPEPHNTTLLYDIWDSSCSILHCVQKVSKDAGTWRIGQQIFWADACRAIFCAAMVLRKLRNLESLSVVSATTHHTLVPLQKTLNESLTYMSDLWLQKVQQGPTVAKAFLYLDVLRKVAGIALGASDYDHLSAGIQSANETVEEMRRIVADDQSPDQRQQQRPSQQHLQHSSIPMLTPPLSDHSHLPSAAMPSSPFELSDMIFPKGNIANLVQAGSMDARGIDVNDLKFHASFTPGSQPQPAQKDYFGDLNRDPNLPASLPHFHHAFPASMQDTGLGNIPGSNAEDMQQPRASTQETMLMNWLDEDRTDSLPMDFDPRWGS